MIAYGLKKDGSRGAWHGVTEQQPSKLWVRGSNPRRITFIFAQKIKRSNPFGYPAFSFGPFRRHRRHLRCRHPPSSLRSGFVVGS